MPDPIDQAINQATAAAKGAASGAGGAIAGNAINTANQGQAAANQAQAAANQALGAANAGKQQLENLPFDKDPDIIKRRADAEIQQKKAQAEEYVLNIKEKSIDEGKKKLSGLKTSLLSLVPKPIIDPKILMAVSLLKQAKDIAKNRKKTVKENNEKGRELYKYDIKKEPPAPPIVDLPLVAPPAPSRQVITPTDPSEWRPRPTPSVPIIKDLLIRFSGTTSNPPVDITEYFTDEDVVENFVTYTVEEFITNELKNINGNVRSIRTDYYEIEIPFAFGAPDVEPKIQSAIRRFNTVTNKTFTIESIEVRAVDIFVTINVSEQKQESQEDQQARQQFRREQNIKLQEERVERAKKFVDTQRNRLNENPTDPAVQRSYDNAVKVYDGLVADLQKIKSDPTIIELT